MASVLDRESKEKKTERHIKDAFLSLLSERPYYKIRVIEVIERAEVGRSTFYMHFSDIEGLLESIERKMLNLLILYSKDAIGKDGKLITPFDQMVGWFEACFEHKHVLLALTGNNGDPYFLIRLNNKVAKELANMMEDEHVPNDELRPYFVKTLSSAYIGLMLYAVSLPAGQTLSPVRLSQIINHTRAAWFMSDKCALRLDDQSLFGQAGELL